MNSTTSPGPAPAPTSPQSILAAVQVNLFAGVLNTTPVKVLALTEALTLIQNGTYRPHVQQLQYILATEGEARYKAAKTQLDAVTFCGTFSTRNKVSLTQHNGMVHGDLDHLPDVQAVKTQLCADPYTVYCFASPSGSGLKVGLHVAIVPDDAAYKLAWQAAADYHHRAYGIWWDTSGKDVSRLCFLSDDPTVYFNPDAALFLVPATAPASAPPPQYRPVLPALTLDDSTLIDKAMHASGGSGAKFTGLWAGDATGYPSQSEADFNLCCRLVWWTQHEETRVARLFRQSALYATIDRKKGNAEDYLARTISNAMATETGDYDPTGRLGVSSNGSTAPQQALDAADAAQLAADALLARLVTCGEDAAKCDAIFDALPALVPLDTLRWVRLKHQLKAAVPTVNVQDLERARNALKRTAAQLQASRSGPTAAASGWQSQLLTTKAGDPTENVSNIALYLEHHPAWSRAFWWDTVRSLPMVGNDPISEPIIAAIARWLGTDARMSVRSLRLVEQCVVAQCHAAPRDLLQEWLAALPAWDTTPRLRQWLSKAASIPLTARLSPADLYCMDVSRLLPVSLVARALAPGCLYRNVVILEGPENSGKSTLVRTLASPEWYVELSNSLEGKEGHMLLQGAWLAELAELDALSRTEETRLKAFITLREDTWIPKYSNHRTTRPRRTVFVGTTNERSYLRGLSGNTRFLPITTGAIDLAYVAQVRDQLFAEALDYYHSHPADWWQLSTDGETEASTQRDARRTVNVYEAALSTWLEVDRFTAYSNAVKAGTPSPTSVTPVAGETTWTEIAEGFLKIVDLERWKDMGLQKQIASALRALDWEPRVDKPGGKTRRFWGKVTS